MVVNTEVAVAPTEVVRTDKSIALTKEDLPWLPEQSHKVPLVRIRSATGDFLFGSAVQSKGLVEAASRLDEHRSAIVNNLLHTHLPQFAEGFNPHVIQVEHPRTHQPIFYLKNKGGQRVYFMRFGRIENAPVIIKIAACDKANQTAVYAAISTESRRGKIK